MALLVFGATGKVGGQVIKQLLEATSSTNTSTSTPNIFAAVRDPEKAAKALASSSPAVQIVKADLTDSASVERVIKETNADKVFVYAFEENVESTIKAMAHAKHIVFLSSWTVKPALIDVGDPLALRHAVVEKAIQQTGVTYTFIRAGYFASNVNMLWGNEIRKNNSISYPLPDSFVGTFVASEDMAAVAVRAFFTHDLDNEIVYARGADALTFRQAVEILSRVTNKPIRVETVSEQSFREKLGAFLPPAIVDSLVRLTKVTDPTREGSLDEFTKVLQRKPLSFEEYLTIHKNELNL